MERFGILEMEFVADLHRIEEREQTKFSAFRTILDNNFNFIPAGWSVVFLRNTPVQILPDALLIDIKEISTRGFMHDSEDKRLVCLYDANTEEGRAMFRAIMGLVVGWLDANM